MSRKKKNGGMNNLEKITQKQKESQRIYRKHDVRTLFSFKIKIMAQHFHWPPNNSCKDIFVATKTVQNQKIIFFSKEKGKQTVGVTNGAPQQCSQWDLKLLKIISLLHYMYKVVTQDPPLIQVRDNLNLDIIGMHDRTSPPT